MIAEIKYLLSIESKGIKLGLERTHRLSKECQNPHKNLKIIQVAGTNGKGSTSAMIANILQKANYKVGLFTSPHLVNINERIRINGVSINDSDIAEYINLYKKSIEKTDASFFETVTIMAFWYFHCKSVDYAIMETGLGGRLDSVSIASPILSVITSISLDHAEILGDTLIKIAKEKAGIIKCNIPCVTIKHSKDVHQVIESECMKKNSPLTIINENNKNTYNPALLGDVHIQNAQLAEKAIHLLENNKINNVHINKGIESVKWPGRNQIIQEKPLIIFDVAHNEMGIASFINFIKNFSKKKKILILSLQKRKKIINNIREIEDTFDEIILCETNNKRTMGLNELQNNFQKLNKIKLIKSDYDAIKYAISTASINDSIGIIGTHHFGESIAKIFNISFNLI